MAGIETGVEAVIFDWGGTLSTTPASQVGHTEGSPDAVVRSLLEVPHAVRSLARA